MQQNEAADLAAARVGAHQRAKAMFRVVAVLNPCAELAFRRLVDLAAIRDCDSVVESATLSELTRSYREWPAVRDALVKRALVLVEGELLRIPLLAPCCRDGGRV